MSENATYVFGIDLGTTYSCISYLKDGHPVVCQSLEGENTTPSVVRMMPEEDSPVVGRTAKDMAVIYPDYTIQFVKSKIGHVESFEYGSEGDKHTTTPVDVSAEILKKLAADASTYLNTTVKNVVITVPAYFGNNEKDATREAGIQAGLNVIDIVEEPTAAAFYYGCEKSAEDEVICIFDLGGGTFDVTAMKMEKGKMTVLTTDGNHDLGGRNWDGELIEMVKEKFRDATGYDEEFDSEILQDLQIKCENAKRQLTNVAQTNIAITIDRKNKANIPITREEFDSRTSSLLATAIDLTHQVFDRVAERGEKIKKILLVGGSTFMPQVSEAIKSEFDVPIELNEPNEAVSKGACIYNAWKISRLEEGDSAGDGEITEKGTNEHGETVITIGHKDGTKEEVALSLPPAIADTIFIPIATKSYGIMAKVNGEPKLVNLVNKENQLPYTFSTSEFCTEVAGQTSICLQLYQNESLEHICELDEGIYVVESELSGLPENLPSGTNVEISFGLSENGLIEITGSYNGTPLEGKLERICSEGIGNKEG